MIPEEKGRIRNYVTDEGSHAIRARPLGICLQEPVSNRQKLLGSRVLVVNVLVKRLCLTESGMVSGDERK